MIEVDRTGAGAKCDAGRRKRAGCRRRRARARADVECSSRTGIRRNPNIRRGNSGAVGNRESTVPELPILRLPLPVQVDPAPVTVAVPSDPAALAIEALVLLTVPPF